MYLCESQEFQAMINFGNKSKAVAVLYDEKSVF